MVFVSSRLREKSRVVCSELDVKITAFECKQRFVLALPLLELVPLVTLSEADITPRTFPLCTQTLGLPVKQKPVTSCPAHRKAVIHYFINTKSCVLALQRKA